MSKRPTISPSAPAIGLGLVAGEIATAAAGDGPSAPDWIRVTPRGSAATRDGRSYSFDPEALVARFSADAVDVAVDTDHGLALRAVRGERVDAVGYAAELQARPDGTYARVTWNDGGRAVLAARTHRYVSPTFHHDETGRATWLHSISLVAAPALSMPALLHALGHTPEPRMKRIAAALGLPETADEAACLAAIGAPHTQPIAKALGLPDGSTLAACLAAIGTLKEGAGAGELVTQLQAQLSATTGRLAAVEKAARDKEVTELLEGALKERRIVPAQREHLAALCVTEAGLASVRAMLGATVPGLQPSGLDGRQPGTGEGEQDPVALAARARAIQAERETAGVPLGWAEAVTLAAQAKA